MGHRHMFNTPLIHETDADEGWNHAEQPYLPMARSGVSGSSSLVHPVENTTIQGGPSTSLWNPPPRSSGYSSSTLNAQLPHYQPQAPTPSHDPFPHQPPGGNFHMVPDAYSHHPSSSSLSGQTVPGVDCSFYNQTMGSGRGPYKRKSPGITLPYDRGITCRYYDAGSSSNQYLPADGLQEKRSTESHHMPWEYPPGYRVNSLSIGGEGMLRNVRSRAGIHMEPNLARTRLPSNYLYCSFSSRSTDQSNLVDFRGQGSNPPRREWDPSLVAGHVVNCDTESGVYSNNAISNGNPVPQNANNHQSVRGVRSGYCQTSVPSFGSSSSNFHTGQVGASDEGLQMTAESYLSRHPRVFSTTRLRNGERIGRTAILRDRYRSITEQASLRDRLTSEGLMVADRPTFYESRTLFDHHREMRLDVDNMSYEELLVLGERIGSVSTGLSDGLISKCLTESIYCSSDQSQDDGKCVICLEEYKNMDDVGTLKCRHDFHVGCIRKWLSMKNLCPICKASAMDDGVKEKSSA
ncbi:E3 ubiquitin-protein ligase MBR2 isoform X1 [Sesamum indicum]|uniref:RING-type E3 ubiquitin transferase n=1 Tax=Sesamum indicum TaxID=4182 RepID=A0A6I9T1N4_SESIN|nr:E3 ubiquitin-protein ligase MBR2 isoform X1 [Sesamum indicum]XP_011077358.1 E3 ubiquitin-protein ligase MBR2 isoform X1 [Sesamum indicum]XP_011077359.1 E3 ubiquitin-protein ligase MBR2 isoform X1 [Sesamum indicum]XP_011077360.1 E3 ubiquitin-protein ligase MBR2 isoform X1 [Sesamum indicum]XP_020549465.1 E3 ubiquitin-protein ligase MBR2 isoform X1 [Sesamum indicum]XP_020549466.1 E3 ubiquitin-protein ligase MBR2 isoform X1 [Sesamum indicum]